MSGWDWLLLGALAAGVFFALRAILRARRKGGCAGCCGGCRARGDCPEAEAARRNAQNRK